MADIVISIVTKIAEYLVDPVLREVRFCVCGQNIINNLKNEKEKLMSERDSLLDRVEQAKNRGEIIEKPVEKWLNDVEIILQEVANLEQTMGANNNCFQGRCPTLKRYRLCKQMEKKTKEIVELKGGSNIQPFSHPAPLPGIQYESSENVFYFESTKRARDQLMEALQDDWCYMIGVYGMGGSGKTTLVTEVGRRAEESNLFDKVISFTVSQTPNIRTIQGKLADMLNIKLEEETEEGRAQRIWMSLKEKKRILIIVDDLWGRFELRDVGIRLDKDYKGRWKVLLTTRRQEICDLMECEKRIHLGLLSENESWTLFKRHSNINDESSKTMKDVPRKVCKECKGLPIAIPALGSSLKGKSDVEWKVALSSLMHSEAIGDDMEEGLRDVYRCLKLSYDYLKNKEAQFVFLICSMFPEDYDIPIEDLIRYATGLGLGGRYSLEWVRSRIQAGINKLLDSCLLLHADVGEEEKEEKEEEEDVYDDDEEEEKEDCVKMHDLVRDVALWIAEKSEDHKIFVNVDKPLSSVVMGYDIRDHFAISSWFEENQISLQLDAPNLEILLLHINYVGSLDLSDVTFKEGDNKLKVFTVINEPCSSVQLSLPCLIREWTNLQIVRLNGWDLADISFIASLTRLEVLDLQHCKLNELPIEIGKLKRLKMLDLRGCVFHQEKYNGAIGKCLQLQELYASDNISNYLSQGIMDILTHPKLQRFVINYRISCVDKRVVELEKFDVSNLRASGNNLLQIADVVSLSCCHGGCKNVIPDLITAVGGMRNLSRLYLEEEEEMECILDATSISDRIGSLQVDASIPRLVQLRLSELKSLKELCRGTPLCFFEKLEQLLIDNCPQLHTIFPVECNLQNLKILRIKNCLSGEVLFSMSVVQSLQRLEQLAIEDIDGLKHLIRSGRGHGSNTNMELSAAKGNSRSLMPNLKRVRIGNCIKLESWFPICCMEGLAQLQTVQIVDVPKLQTIFPVECNLQNLKALMICKLETDKWRLGEVLFSTSVAQSLQQLKCLVIEGIDGLKHIIGNGRGDCSNTSILPPRNSPFLMPNLNILEINDCNELESFLPICCVEGLTQLQLLEIVDVPKLRHVFGECDHTDHSSLQYGNQILLPRLESMIFKRLENLIDMCPKNYPARWHSPDEKIVEDCPNFATTSV